jgi:hypothetical protein
MVHASSLIIRITAWYDWLLIVLVLVLGAYTCKYLDYSPPECEMHCRKVKKGRKAEGTRAVNRDRLEAYPTLRRGVVGGGSQTRSMEGLFYASAFPKSYPMLPLEGSTKIAASSRLRHRFIRCTWHRRVFNSQRTAPFHSATLRFSFRIRLSSGVCISSAFQTREGRGFMDRGAFLDS